MRVGFVIYHDTTECEFVSVNECLGKVRQLDLPNPPENHIIGVTPEVVGWNGIVIKPHTVYREADIQSYDLLVIPGGQASRTVRYDEEFMAWFRGWDPERTLAACCSGALILAEAGFLQGKRATTHALAIETLREYDDVEVVSERVVEARQRRYRRRNHGRIRPRPSPGREVLGPGRAPRGSPSERVSGHPGPSANGRSAAGTGRLASWRALQGPQPACRLARADCGGLTPWARSRARSCS